ncbi:energy-coupling factor ABC transporter ATP-binding protein [Eubacterium aggregans]|uniref:ABC transporter ATP-binding protein n=1 Tax=Eubacterium aggregans TaxID=81409 RepID=A0A1H3YSE0_9FIRM|nr:ATP-binding cassette domain-containing protein [Eubacterium aggregans]MDD4691254.1 ATP-binding cassette domain-containing protein [Eubacterium aggregans]SEA14091.1 cobalt/nickel transport system ATP-binding protein [Eubacterium aggregans]
MQESILEITDLKYAYSGENAALNGITVDIRQGERIAVVGSNGAGKSTFFLNINGVLIPDEGTIRFKGQTITRNKKDLNTLRKGVGIVFQDADNQIIASTVMGEVSFGPMNLKLSRDEVVRRVDEALDYMNLMEFRDRAPHYCSGGEKKRITIADIIAMHPEVIIFDEPTASLDPLNAVMLEEVLSKLVDQGKTLLISTHDMDFAYRWAKRVIVFAGGDIIADGTPEAIFSNEDIRIKANLKKPILLDVRDAMIESGRWPEDGPYPKTVGDFRKILLK